MLKRFKNFIKKRKSPNSPHPKTFSPVIFRTNRRINNWSRKQEKELFSREVMVKKKNFHSNKSKYIKFEILNSASKFIFRIHPQNSQVNQCKTKVSWCFQNVANIDKCLSLMYFLSSFEEPVLYCD
jgi:hypothetical protein